MVTFSSKLKNCSRSLDVVCFSAMAEKNLVKKKLNCHVENAMKRKRAKEVRKCFEEGKSFFQLEQK